MFAMHSAIDKPALIASFGADMLHRVNALPFRHYPPRSFLVVAFRYREGVLTLHVTRRFNVHGGAAPFPAKPFPPESEFCRYVEE